MERNIYDSLPYAAEEKAVLQLQSGIADRLRNEGQLSVEQLLAMAPDDLQVSRVGLVVEAVSNLRDEGVARVVGDAPDRGVYVALMSS